MKSYSFKRFVLQAIAQIYQSKIKHIIINFYLHRDLHFLSLEKYLGNTHNLMIHWAENQNLGILTENKKFFLRDIIQIYF